MGPLHRYTAGAGVSSLYLLTDGLAIHALALAGQFRTAAAGVAHHAKTGVAAFIGVVGAFREADNVIVAALLLTLGLAGGAGVLLAFVALGLALVALVAFLLLATGLFAFRLAGITLGLAGGTAILLALAATGFAFLAAIARIRGYRQGNQKHCKRQQSGY